MATIVAATVPPDQFALSEALATVPEAEIELVRLVTRQTARTSLVWGSAEEPERLTEGLDEDATTTDVEVLARFDGGRLYEVRWDPSSRVRLFPFLSGDAIVLDACGTGEGWSLRLLFSDRADVSATHELCAEHGVDLQVRTVCRLADSPVGGAFDLTDSQYDALTAALDVGYYEVPRRTTLKELSDSFGVSHQALSERIRRGHGALVHNALRSNARSSVAGL